jgi:hypothetical protein
LAQYAVQKLQLLNLNNAKALQRRFFSALERLSIISF